MNQQEQDDPLAIQEMIANLPASLHSDLSPWKEVTLNIEAPINTNLHIPTNDKRILGKRKIEQEDDEDEKKQFVFKGFTMEPTSKKIKFVNSERRSGGINGNFG
jgi:GTP-sensing pleiotropic transcriptional regulator CodY